MADIKLFREVNSISQKELAEYLQVSPAYLSQVENRKRGLSEEKLSKLINNTKGWDVSMLIIEDAHFGDNIQVNGGRNNVGKSGAGATEVLAFQKEVELLRAQVEELKMQNDRYWEMICKLTEK